MIVSKRAFVCLLIFTMAGVILHMAYVHSLDRKESTNISKSGTPGMFSRLTRFLFNQDNNGIERSMDTRCTSSENSEPNLVSKQEGGKVNDRSVDNGPALGQEQDIYPPNVSTESKKIAKIGKTLKAAPRFAIILAYMHTGSSYTARLIQQHPGSIVYLEPLETLKLSAYWRRDLSLLNGTVMHPSGEEDFKKLGNDIVNNIFLCKLRNLDVETLWKVKSNLTKNMKTLSSCQSVPGNSNVHSLESATELKSCLPTLVSMCSNATFRALKTIRMTMSMVEDVLVKFKNVKIVHLLRDPRSMLDSNVRRKELGVQEVSVFEKRAKLMCDTMLADLRVSTNLKQAYPGHIFTVRHEDITTDPVLEAKRMFKYLDLPFTDSVEKFVVSRSIKSEKNASTIASVWRSHISKQHLEIVNKNCKELYKALGYPAFKTLKEVRNISIPGYVEENVFQKMRL